MITGVLVTKLRRLPTAGGEVRHALKRSDAGFAGFGEAYFTCIERDIVRGWKKHHRMVSNLTVAHGAIRFMIRDASGAVMALLLSPDADVTHLRLTVPPGLWLAFGGLAPGVSVILNLADLEHDPAEAETRPLDAFDWSWDP